MAYQFGVFRLDPAKRRLWRDDELVSLTPKAFETLLVLVERAGQVVEKDDILKRVWPDTFVEEATLAQNISTVRKALGDTAETPTYVATVPRRGPAPAVSHPWGRAQWPCSGRRQQLVRRAIHHQAPGIPIPADHRHRELDLVAAQPSLTRTRLDSRLGITLRQGAVLQDKVSCSLRGDSTQNNLRAMATSD